MSVEEFKKSLESVENKDRFLEHLETRDNSDGRLAALNLVEPIIREPHIEIFIKDKDGTIKKEYIKAFKDENNTRLYMLITQDNDTILRTFIPKLNERYMRNHVRNADIIHSFIQPNRTAKSDNALSDVVVYGENTTKKPLTDQEELLKTSENLNESAKDATKLSPLEQAQAEKLAKLESEKLESEKEFTRLKEQEQVCKAALKKKLEHERGNGNKIFDFYSDRNFKDFRDASLHSGNHPYGNNPTQKPLTDQEELLKTSENLNEATAGAALKYHIKRALERSHSISDFSKNLELSAQNAKFTNNTLKIIEELNNSVKQASEEIKEATKPSNLVKSIREQDARPFEVIEDKEAFLKDLNAIKPTQLPREIDTDSFLNAFNGVENKENFIKHLKNKPDSKHRLAYLNLVEPTLKEPNITLIFKEQGKEVKKEHIKAFQGDPKTIYYFLVTQDNDSKLITGLRISDNYLKAEIDKADIIHSFIPQDS
ncbi:hypothetical protein HpHA251_12410 [Helicobacter pylori]